MGLIGGGGANSRGGGLLEDLRYVRFVRKVGSIAISDGGGTLDLSTGSTALPPSFLKIRPPMANFKFPPLSAKVPTTPPADGSSSARQDKCQSDSPADPMDKLGAFGQGKG